MNNFDREGKKYTPNVTFTMPLYPASPKRNRFTFESDQSQRSDVSPAVSPHTRAASSMEGDVRNDNNDNHDHLEPISPIQTHDTSGQHNNVIYDIDRAIDSVQEFHTAHSQHGTDGGREVGGDGVLESKESTLEPHAIPHPGPQDLDLHHKKEADAIEKSVESRSYTENGSASAGLGPEQLEEDSRAHTGPTFYQRYRIFFHLIIFLFFTGFVENLYQNLNMKC